MKHEDSSSRQRHALITGASSGIGESFARLLAEKGYDMTLIARRENKLRQIKTHIVKHHDVHVEIIKADLSCENDIDHVCEYIKKNENISLLINNAGFGTSLYFSEKDIQNEIKMVKLHDIATIALIHAALPAMRKRRSGQIINVSSVAAYTNVPGNTTYGGSKAFINAFSIALQKELADDNIKIQALCPGFTYSGFHDTDEYENFSRNNVPSIFWMKSDKVAEISLKALDQRKVIIVPGFLNKIILIVRRIPFFSKLAKVVFRKKNHGKRQ